MRYRYRDTLILSLTLLYQRAKHTSLDVILILILMKGSESRSRPGRGSPERDRRTATHAGDSSGPGSGGCDNKLTARLPRSTHMNRGLRSAPAPSPPFALPLRP